jgi:hypothetical protein
VAHFARAAALRHRNVGSECGAPEGTQIDGKNPVFFSAQEKGYTMSGVQFNTVALAVVERKRIARKLAAAGDSETRG